MKTRVFIFALFVTIITIAFWALKAPVVDTEKLAAANTASSEIKTAVVAQNKTRAAVAAPVVAPVAPRGDTSSTPLALAPDPIEEAKAQINDFSGKLAAQLEAGDFADLFDKYSSPVDLARMDPNAKKTFDEIILETASTPRAGVWIQVLQDMPNLTPTFSDDGNTATYRVNSPAGVKVDGQLGQITLKRVDGKWYFTPTSLLICAAGFGLIPPPQPQNP